MSDLRSTGELELHADVIILLHRPGYYSRDLTDRTTELIIAKQRNGPTGTVTVTFIPENLLFTDIPEERTVLRIT